MSLDLRAKLLLFLALSLYSWVALAQKNVKESPVRLSVAELIEQYRFNEALELFEGEKQNIDDEMNTDDCLNRLYRCAQMLPVTEKICFVDSLVVSKAEMFQSLSLSEDVGRFGTLGQICSELAVTNPMVENAPAYMNGLHDCVYFAMPDTSGISKLCSSDNLMGHWTSPEPLVGLHHLSGVQYAPFMLSDGVTFYYSAESPEGIGGYDLYVTRHVAGSNKFLVPELLAMPFNSPSNEYFYLYDEVKEVGCFATDRWQSADSVCIYFFLPNPDRKTYQSDALTESEIIKYAAIHSISDTWTDIEIVKEAKERLKSAQSLPDQMVRYVINDNIIYTTLSDFKSPTARRIAQQLTAEQQKLNLMKEELDQLRRSYVKGNAKSEVHKNRILQLEYAVRDIEANLETMEKNMRRAELQ